MQSEKSDLALRLVMERPLQGVSIALQSGATGTAELIGPVRASSDALIFEFTVMLNGSTLDGGPRLLGPLVHGPPTGRFVYLNAGVLAGQPGSPWQRRAKVPLGGISWQLIEESNPNGRLTAHIDGTARDGGPACATVALLQPGWREE